MECVWARKNPRESETTTSLPFKDSVTPLAIQCDAHRAPLSIPRTTLRVGKQNHFKLFLPLKTTSLHSRSLVSEQTQDPKIQKSGAPTQIGYWTRYSSGNAPFKFSMKTMLYSSHKTRVQRTITIKKYERYIKRIEQGNNGKSRKK